MVHYIRLLSSPRVLSKGKLGNEVHAVVSITTDLGDDFFWREMPLIFRVLDAQDPTKVMATARILWKPHGRVAKANLSLGRQHDGQLCRLHVAAGDLLKLSPTVPPVLDVWSAGFSLSTASPSEPLVYRSFVFSPSITVRIWEELGDSIARHVWDAALACLMLVQNVKDDAKLSPYLHTLFSQAQHTPMNFLELGAGCGLVGIALASLLPNATVSLTDLGDAQNILKVNVSDAQLAPGSRLQQHLLDWTDVSTASNLPNQIDLIIVADCVYNTDSIPYLVKMIHHLIDRSPMAKILVARKPRHTSELLFFELLGKAPVSLIEEFAIDLPQATEIEVSPPSQVEFHLYGHS